MASWLGRPMDATADEQKTALAVRAPIIEQKSECRKGEAGGGERGHDSVVNFARLLLFSLALAE